MLKQQWAHDGTVLDLQLENGKGNVLDGATIDELTIAVREAASRTTSKAIRVRGAGEHFSFGVSVEEHAPGQVATMLDRFHGLFRALDAASLPTVAVVRGRCLGGGLELAAWCTWIFAAPDALFAQPEVRLGVFPPLASIVLPWRLGGGAAMDLCCSGRTWTAHDALARGLLAGVGDDPWAASEAFLLEHVAPRSAVALRHTERAARHGLSRLLREDLPRLERQYLGDLMKSHDGPEGIAAFMAKRPPRWEHR